jgi:hypothetical protein
MPEGHSSQPYLVNSAAPAEGDPAMPITMPTVIDLLAGYARLAHRRKQALAEYSPASREDKTFGGSCD